MANTFEDTNCISQYPTPRRWIHDNGNEFLGPEFLQILFKNKIMSVLTTVKNSQSNVAAKRLYQTLNTILAISFQEKPPQSCEDIESFM